MTKSKWYCFMEKAIAWIALIVTGLLFVSGFLSTAYTLDMTFQVVLFRWDNLIVSILVLLLILVAGGIFFRPVQKSSFRKKVLLYLTLLCYFGAGVFLAVFGRTVPAADAMTVYQIGESLAAGNLAVIHPTDSYLSYYPHQLGLSSFFAVCLYFIKWIPISIEGFHFIKIIYTFCICISLYFSYKIVDGIWKKDEITSIYLLLSLGNFPMIIYSSFVYGEVPGYCAFVIGAYFMMKSVQEDKASFRNFLISLLFLTLAVWLRKNMLIMIIGVVIVCIGLFLRTNQKKWLAYGALYLSFSVLFPAACESMYEQMAGRELNSGVTSLSYFAMGMQEGSRGPGWYNGFNIETYKDSHMDTKLTNDISKEVIQERAEVFAQNPVYALKFYAGKYLSQWTDGTYACRQAVLAEYGGRMPLIQEIYAGKYSPLFIEYCNQLQNLIYFGAFVWSMVMLKKVRSGDGKYLEIYLGMIIVVGGLLFHMMWEANGRYILLFGQILYFYAAVGWYRFGNMLYGKYAKRKGMHA